LIGGSRHRLAEINCVKRISKKIRYLSGYEPKALTGICISTVNFGAQGLFAPAGAVVSFVVAFLVVSVSSSVLAAAEAL